ncbi:hypothetical protein [Methylocapsa aurea]|uniref:hypothetical protein n=1 Tax=Methylocapsa aurea TaxID=663610 RepID=UPI00068CE5F7|nr:hypothetical protein [Methylocapsa aurea]
MARGGKRPGAGRRKGSTTTRTREIAERAFEEGVTPLEYMLSVMRDIGAQPAVRLDAAKYCAPYVHPRLAAIEMTGRNGGPIETVDSSPLETARRIAFIFEKARRALEGK